MNTANPVLTRKLGLSMAKPKVAEAPNAPTPMRLMRRALGRAADKALGLPASVLGISEEDMHAEELIESGPAGWIVLGLRDGSNAGLTGLFLIDQPLRSALVEMQTMGRLFPGDDEERAVTRTDCVLSIPFADQLLKELAEVKFGGDELDPGAYDMGPMVDLRTAGLVMMQGTYRCWRITVQFGGSERQGEMLIAMRPKNSAPVAPVKVAPRWAESLRAAVNEAPADLNAVLAKTMVPINEIENFEVGQVIHLPGTTVGSVSLCGPGGEIVATARLGQIAGKRAVRVEVETLEMQASMPNVGQSRAASVAVPGLVPDVAFGSEPDPLPDIETMPDIDFDAAPVPDPDLGSMDFDAETPFDPDAIPEFDANADFDFDAINTETDD